MVTSDDEVVTTDADKKGKTAAVEAESERGGQSGASSGSSGEAAPEGEVEALRARVQELESAAKAKAVEDKRGPIKEVGHMATVSTLVFGFAVTSYDRAMQMANEPSGPDTADRTGFTNLLYTFTLLLVFTLAAAVSATFHFLLAVDRKEHGTAMQLRLKESREDAREVSNRFFSYSDSFVDAGRKYTVAALVIYLAAMIVLLADTHPPTSLLIVSSVILSNPALYLLAASFGFLHLLQCIPCHYWLLEWARGRRARGRW